MDTEKIIKVVVVAAAVALAGALTEEIALPTKRK